MITETAQETYRITDICATKTPAEVRPVRIEEDPVWSGDDITLFASARAYLSSREKCTMMELIDSEDEPPPPRAFSKPGTSPKGFHGTHMIKIDGGSNC